MTQQIIRFINSPFGLLVIGAFIGAIGLYTWQRQDWIFKEEYLRTQTLLDRKADLLERINADTGSFVARAANVIQAIRKNASQEQINTNVDLYNEEQSEWFGRSAANRAVSAVYFPASAADRFSDIVQAVEEVDRRIYLYGADKDDMNYDEALKAIQEVRRQIQDWNEHVFPSIATGDVARN